jgi:hypothetical protein
MRVAGPGQSTNIREEFAGPSRTGRAKTADPVVAGYEALALLSRILYGCRFSAIRIDTEVEADYRPGDSLSVTFRYVERHL